MIPIWLLLGLGAAVSKAAKSIASKQAATLTDDYVTGLATRLIPAPLLLLLAIIAPQPFKPMCLLQPTVLVILLLEGLSLTAVTVLLARAFRLGDASRISPLLTITPIPLLGTSFIFLGEVPALFAAVGVLLISAGAYTINLDEGEGLLDPFRYMYETRVGRIVLVAVGISSMIPVFDKAGLQATTPLTWAVGTSSVGLVGMLILWTAEGRTLPTTARAGSWLAAVGVATAFIWPFQLFGYALTNVAYVVSVKRMSVLLVVVVGGSFYGEGWKRRVLPALSMVIGAIIIGLYV